MATALDHTHTPYQGSGEMLIVLVLGSEPNSVEKNLTNFNSHSEYISELIFQNICTMALEYKF